MVSWPKAAFCLSIRSDSWSMAEPVLWAPIQLPHVTDGPDSIMVGSVSRDRLDLFAEGDDVVYDEPRFLVI